MTTRTSGISTVELSEETGVSGEMSGSQQHPLVEAGQEAGQSAGMLAERATNLGFQQADRAREGAADGLTQVTESIRRVSLDLQTEQPQIANVVETAADQAERIAEYLRTTDARQILSTVEDVARRQPLIFLGGAFVLGVALSRFIKAAGGPQGGGSQYGQGQWAQGGQSTYGVGDQWTAADYQATGPGSRGTNGLTGDDRIAEGL